MTLQVIPTTHGPNVTTHDYSLTFPIAGVGYLWRFRYSSRMQRWILSITHPTGAPVIVGAPIVLGVDLFSYCAPGMRPPGGLVCLWTRIGDEREPEEFDLGRHARLTYYERVSDFDPQEPQVPALV